MLKGLPVLLLPVGPVNQSDLENLHRDLSVLTTRCALGRPLPAPETAYDRRRNQFLAYAFLGLASRAALALANPRGRVLAVTGLDLYADDLNFVFGMAEPRGRTAVISLHRLGPGASSETRRLRALKEAVHEIGHTLGLAHCPDPMCVMHFSNSLADTDRKGSALCAVCERRLGARKP